MNTISPTKQLMLNLSAGIIVFFVNSAINFFLSPFIVRNLGVEANGFIQLANSFISYIVIITMALNSMASRFITVAIYEKNDKKANEYYSSTFIGNIIILVILLIPIIIGIIFLDYFIDVSDYLLNQVRILFFFILLNFFISTAGPVWNVAFFATNRIYLKSIGNIISYLVRATIIIVLFAFFPLRIWYVGVATVFATLAFQFWQYKGKTRLLDEIRIKKADMKLERIKELLASGIWNSINQLGVVLFNGIDLMMSNIFINSEAMGIVAIAKIIPTILASLQSTIVNTFTPNLTILYAKGKISELVKEIFKAGKLLLIVMGIPFSGFMIFGEVFFSLWMPNQNSHTLQTLSIISMSNLIFLLGIQPLWQIFIVLNRNRPNSLTVLGSGIVNVILTLIALHYTNLGIFAILGISSIISILRNILFTIPYSAIYLGLKWTTFFPLVALTCLTLVVNYGIGLFLMNSFHINSWSSLIGVGIIFSCISLIINSFIVLNKIERMHLFRRIFRVS